MKLLWFSSIGVRLNTKNFILIPCGVTELSLREDSQIDFATVNVFCTFGGGGGGVGGFTQERFSNFSNNRFFQTETTGKTLLARKNIIGNYFKPNKSFKLGQIWRRQLHS